jgi:nucleotide-binding universal stress UspA family protein
LIIKQVKYLSQIHNDESLISNDRDSTFLPDSALRSTEDTSSDPRTIVPSAYSKILVPHDNTEMSDKALGHAIYLANATGAEINILFVMEDINDISNSSLVASIYENETLNTTDEKQKNKNKLQSDNLSSSSIKERIDEKVEYIKLKKDNEDTKNKEIENSIEEDSETNVKITAHGQAKKMIEEKLSLCKSAGATGRISFRIATGRSVDEEIINLANTGEADLIVMTSSTISSSIRSIGSTARKVIDNVNVPVLVIRKKDDA